MAKTGRVCAAVLVRPKTLEAREFARPAIPLPLPAGVTALSTLVWLPST